MNKTPQLKNLLSVYQGSLPAEEFASFSREVDRLQTHYYEVLNSYRAGAERAQATQSLIDEQVTQNGHIKTSCQKGCGACCHLEVEINEDDADRLAKSILNLNMKIDEERLQDQAGRTRLDPAWARGAVASNRCVMLGADQACSNYENRPSVCRKHSVTSPAADCATLGAQPVPLLIPMNEIILSAAISLPQNTFGSLPKMLAAALARLRSAQAMHHLEFREEELAAARESAPARDQEL